MVDPDTGLDVGWCWIVGLIALQSTWVNVLAFFTVCGCVCIVVVDALWLCHGVSASAAVRFTNAF